MASKNPKSEHKLKSRAPVKKTAQGSSDRTKLSPTPRSGRKKKYVGQGR